MKKFVSIVIALVMVLSMTSAFALNACATWAPAWDCTADADLCGKGSVKVVPYVKVNTSCGWEWQVSDCATAIKTENVYWAIELTVDKNPDPDWWAQATLEIETDGLVAALDGVVIDLAEVVIFPNGTPEAGVYYLAANQLSWIDVEDWEDLNAANQWAFIFSGRVMNGTVCDDGYSVCATLASYYDGWSVPAYNHVGDYLYDFDGEFAANGAFSGEFYIENADDEDDFVLFAVEDGAILADVRSGNAFYNKVLADFGLANCGTAACITEDNIEANFGWDDEQEDCFDWSQKGAAIVNPECVVDIPKTGDVSVVAYAVMAIVAAAGTMLKK